MELYVADPFADGRWDALVAHHPKASAFHQSGWLRSLALTYGYRPFVVTSSPAGKPFTDGLVLCLVSTWITGSRAVSLPFTDHCEPLLNSAGDSATFARWLQAECDRHQWKYVELRPSSLLQDAGSLTSSATFCFHELDLTPSLQQLFAGLHKNSIQRKIQRAEKEGLSYEVGSSDGLISEFYHLLTITRKRHKLPPQPRSWFKNLMECMGDSARIRVARKEGVAVASILTLRHRSTVIYKYGCSDEKLHNLGGMPSLFWNLIQESKAEGAKSVDFGRSDKDQESLITFKSRFGATKRSLTYYRYPDMDQGEKLPRASVQAMRGLFSILPDFLCPAVGRLLYRHMG